MEKCLLLQYYTGTELHADKAQKNKVSSKLHLEAGLKLSHRDRFLGICGITCVLCSANRGKDLSYFSIIILTYNKFKMNKYGYMNKL